MTLYTIGFTKKTAERFFVMLRQSGAERVVDVRRNNVSQLAGFAKRDDLQFFLRELCDMDYVHMPLLAPEQPILDRYKKEGSSWAEYERAFLEQLTADHVETEVDSALLDNACLLCSEDQPDHCHRRLVAEYLQRHWDKLTIKHLT